MQIAVAEKYCRNWDSNSSKIMLKTEEFTPLQKVVNFLVMAVVLLAPLKMGSMILPGVPQGTPQGVWDVLLNALPVPLLAVFSGVLLALTILAYKVDDCLSFRTHSGRLLWLWLLLPVAAVFFLLWLAVFLRQCPLLFFVFHQVTSCVLFSPCHLAVSIW